MSRDAVLAFLGVKDQPASARAARSGQALGEYCRGADVEECRRMFGEGLARVCATCPD